MSASGNQRIPKSNPSRMRAVSNLRSPTTGSIATTSGDRNNWNAATDQRISRAEAGSSLPPTTRIPAAQTQTPAQPPPAVSNASCDASMGTKVALVPLTPSFRAGLLPDILDVVPRIAASTTSKTTTSTMPSTATITKSLAQSNLFEMGVKKILKAPAAVSREESPEIVCLSSPPPSFATTRFDASTYSHRYSHVPASPTPTPLLSISRSSHAPSSSATASSSKTQSAPAPRRAPAPLPIPRISNSFVPSTPSAPPPTNTRTRSRSSSAALVEYGDDHIYIPPSSSPQRRPVKRARTTPGTDDELLLPASPRKTLGGTYRFTAVTRQQLDEEREVSVANSDVEDSSHKINATQEYLRAVPVPIGALAEPPRTSLVGATVFADRMGALPIQPVGWWQQYAVPHRAPAAEYVDRLEEAFGPGDVERGEELPDGWDDEASSEVESDGIGPERQRAQDWIAQIQVAVKGKRQLVSQDWKALQNSLGDISNMTNAMARAISDDLPRLRESLVQLGNTEIPNNDEYRVGIWAKNLVEDESQGSVTFCCRVLDLFVYPATSPKTGTLSMLATLVQTQTHEYKPQRPHRNPPRKPAVAVVAPTPQHSTSRQSRPPAPIPAPPPQTAAVPQTVAFDVHSYPSADLLRLLASLLTQIAATNDKLDSVAPLAPPSTTPTRTTLATVTPTDAPIWRTLTTASRTAISTPASVLTFHARNIPTISLEAYLLRILKYCPTTNEVFLSLLVYFDRMSKLSTEATGRTFVIDSYNIHRLVIAGVTVASKFFSDVFYTNSRYAKVGGLPQAELNQLELQFLLLNDFRLVIPREEMQRYAEQLILFSNSPDSVRPLPVPVAAPMQAMAAVSVPRQQPPDEDTETETETEGTETDGGWTTDDEPTIRPAHSSAGSSSDDTRSLSSADDTGDERDDDEAMDMEMDAIQAGDRTPEHAMGAGDRTPERRTADGVRTPAPMASS
uniref:Cyclin-domain-containing protein n=1 Tax=Mycena chlorophos TaxID=658473 RepID=A0ABQ0L8N8_MYCCL|nr:cyclin-domain-containing protein [Mycena chlorophos]